MCWKHELHELFELIITIVQTHKSGISQTPIVLKTTCAKLIHVYCVPTVLRTYCTVYCVLFTVYFVPTVPCT